MAEKDTVVDLKSTGANTPPPYGDRGDAHIVGSSPTGAWAGHPLQLAVNDGEGGYDFLSGAGMKDKLFTRGGVASVHTGSALAALQTASDVDTLITSKIQDGSQNGEIPNWQDSAWVPLPIPAGGDGNYKLHAVKSAGAVTLSWVSDP